MSKLTKPLDNMYGGSTVHKKNKCEGTVKVQQKYNNTIVNVLCSMVKVQLRKACFKNLKSSLSY